MKQSSIDWFVRETWELRMQLEKKELTLGEYATKYYALYEQADAMHKEEIMDAFQEGKWDGWQNHKLKVDGKESQWTDPADYYNETFNTKEK